ncbi:Transmembrane protein [Wickerhamomyces ciferrii]|uniref:ER membrane protein complex subunit 3 n=1 Tax=Wickerhamomyces ciferrii (strain ATCC 14091 / BCRC 22168 / CBS 111 / JCM 3599 / NBRC 0793 / NRRL Y-1031 F-60-10) TaxID=1206466 RepID=K0KDJ7_WICCF|nr:Transmembrane protein [Wickerhamomyces ciferrii]CCH41001.1 Transmembrane protein [Wickerhamomyces ciferrii]
MAVPDLIIDPSLRYWVLLPISLVMILFGILRQYIQILLNPTPKLQPLSKIRESEHIKKAQLLKTNYINLPKRDFESRQSYLSEKLSNGEYLAEEIKTDDDQPKNPLTDPGTSDAMMNMAKNSMGNFLSQTIMMGWTNFFFAGFVLMKLPFPLTLRFKQMLQSGVATTDLDVRWVSSISWYFIVTLGLNSIYNVFLGDGSKMPNQMQQQTMAPPMMPGGPTPDKIMNQEANDLKIIPYQYILDDVDSRVLKIYGSK